MERPLTQECTNSPEHRGVDRKGLCSEVCCSSHNIGPMTAVLFIIVEPKGQTWWLFSCCCFFFHSQPMFTIRSIYVSWLLNEKQWLTKTSFLLLYFENNTSNTLLTHSNCCSFVQCLFPRLNRYQQVEIRAIYLPHMVRKPTKKTVTARLKSFIIHSWIVSNYLKNKVNIFIRVKDTWVSRCSSIKIFSNFPRHRKKTSESQNIMKNCTVSRYLDLNGCDRILVQKFNKNKGGYESCVRSVASTT